LFAVGMMRHGVCPLYRTGVVYPWGNVGNVFRGNISHHNIDDGWDLSDFAERVPLLQFLEGHEPRNK